MYKVAIIGLGNWAEKIVRTLGQMENVELVSACRRKSERPIWLPASCTMYNNINDLLQKSIITHVITALPPQAHLEVATKVIRYGLPLWLEKPIALSLEETKNILDLDGHIFVDYIHLYSECFRWMTDHLKIDKNTKIQSIRHLSAPNTHHPFSILYDIGPHDLSMLLSLINNMILSDVSLIKSDIGERYEMDFITDLGCHISSWLGDDGFCSKPRELIIDIPNDGKYSYNVLQQKVFKNNVEIFSAKEPPLKYSIEAFLSGEQVNKDMTIRMMTLLDEIDRRTK